MKILLRSFLKRLEVSFRFLLKPIAQDASDFIQIFKTPDLTLKDRSPALTDELVVETYGLNRMEIALTTLTGYLIFSIKEYLSIQHILDEKSRTHFLTE